MENTANNEKVRPGNINLDNHPCFNRNVCHSVGRVHLPVAPQCNIQCNYCNRKFDCVNESRPGVTSTILSPGQALAYLEGVFDLRNDITVVGIAGPGDPMANVPETMETLRLVRAKYPEIILCLSTNGLGLTEEIVTELAALQVSHVTVTINAVDPEIAAKVYAWARYEKHIHRGLEAGKIMIERQLNALRMIKAHGMIAKVNAIVIPGVNDKHLPVLAKVVGEMGADLMNCIPLLPVPGTGFENLVEPDSKMRFRVRMECGEHVNQMTHCARCRADAIGKLGEAMQPELQELLTRSAALPLIPQDKRPYVAVASREGLLVNQHLGEAKEFIIFSQDPEDKEAFIEVETRKAPPAGGRENRWEQLAEVLADCRTLLVNVAGPSPREVLTRRGIAIVEMEGMIETGLDHVYNGAPIAPRILREGKGCGKGVTCGGDGTGCG
ncbi:MAG TPA: radical SAM protein [Opitutales bacterium]|nr:radical SAM protein [Opitutales bacterium]